MSNKIQLIPLIKTQSNISDIIKIINEHNFDENEVTTDGNTPLIYACAKSLSEVAMALIATGQSHPEQVNTNGDNALIFACSNNGLSEVAMALIATGQSHPEQANTNGNTALMSACAKSLSEVAMALIATDQSHPEQVNTNGNNALIIACDNKLSEVAMALIATGQSHPEQVNINGSTPLMYACAKSLSEVAMALIATGQSHPEKVNKYESTPLIYACSNKLSEVAMALIATGQSHPEQVNNEGNTALIFACGKKLSEVAIALIQTGQSRPEQIDNDGNTALDYAITNNLSEVVDLLNKELNLVIDISQTGFNTITQEEHKIKDYIAENVDNICFQFDNQYILTSRRELSSQLNKKSNIKYGCKTAGDTPAAASDSNIIYDIPYFSMSSISGLQVLVPSNQIKLITENTKQLFVIKLTGKKVASIISQAYIDNEVGIGADHCGTGKERDIYTIMEATPIESNIDEETKTDIYEETKAEPPTNTVKIQYSGNVYDFEIQSNTTIGDIKVKLLNQLGFNESEYKVRVIFLGKMPGDSVLLSELGSGITLQALVNKISSGGRKTKKRNRRKKSVTHRKNIRKKHKKTKKK